MYMCTCVCTNIYVHVSTHDKCREMFRHTCTCVMYNGNETLFIDIIKCLAIISTDLYTCRCTCMYMYM